MSVTEVREKQGFRKMFQFIIYCDYTGEEHGRIISQIDAITPKRTKQSLNKNIKLSLELIQWLGGYIVAKTSFGSVFFWSLFPLQVLTM